MKPILVVGLLAVAALVVTAVGVAKSDDWTRERTYEFHATQAAIPGGAALAAGSAPARFEYALAANATGSQLEATVSFSGQAVQGGNAAIRVKATAPDGRTTTTVTAVLTIAQGGTSAEVVVRLAFTWLDLPGAVTDTQQPDGTTWALPLVIEVTVERPADLPVATYGFTATVAGTVDAYAATLA